MPGRDEHASGRWGNGPRGRISGAVLLIAALTCTLEAESPATKANYSVDNWLLADGEDRDAEEIAANSPFRCDLTGCIGKVKKGKTIALSAIRRRSRRIAVSPISSSRHSASAKGAARHAWWSTGARYRPKARMRSISRGCRSGARALPRRAGGGLGCRSVPFRSRLCRPARLTPAIQVPTTARMIAPSTVIPMSEA